MMPALKRRKEMNKLIIKLAVAAALVVGCGMAGTAFADTTPKNGATQGLKNGLKYIPESDLTKWM